MATSVVALRDSLRLNASETVLVVIDMQEKLDALYFKDTIVVIRHLLKAVKAVGLKTIYVEHEPELYGPTTEALKKPFEEVNAIRVTKVDFSAYSAIKDHIGKGVKTVLICGLAAHCCNYHTTIVDAGYNVQMVTNASISQNQVDRSIMTTATTAIMALARALKHPEIDEIMQLYLAKLPDTGLKANE
ncbi:Protein F35G2.2 [Aphelenchoides avenae]|nr:Protein F35G2.2 [Aphelenchus avenae]KAH7720949.1 Protein F35G2.2 [Aphelenchus avenae]